MSSTMGDFKPTVNTIEEELKKLQELVRELEIQNLQLRNKQNLSKKRSASPVKEVKPSSKNARLKNSHIETIVDNDPDSENPVVSSNKDEYFDDLEIIKVSDIELSDDESWLYMSPKSGKQQKNESPCKWLRNGGSDAENKQLQFSKNALLTKLNELEILSTPNRTVPHAGNPNLRRSQLIYKTTTSVPCHDSPHIDSRTFTRSTKRQTVEFLEKLDRKLNGEMNMRLVELHVMHRRGSDVSSDSLSSCHILEDENDVQEVARMQEESLRMNSPLGTPKRNSGNNLFLRKVSTSSKGSASDLDISESSVFSSAQIANASHSHDYMESSHHMEACQYSDQSSPSESPYGSNASLHNVGKEKVKLGGYRRSLPNLNKDPSSARQGKSQSENSSQLQNHSKGRTIRRSDTSMHAVPKTKIEARSPSRLKQANMPLLQPVFVSPENDIIAVTKSSESNDSRQRIRSGLPKPSRASSVTRSIPRSGIPMPSMLGKKRNEDSWSEGCF